MAMELTHDDVRAIVKLIDEAQHLSEIEVEYGGFRLRVQRGAASEGGSRLAPTVPARPVPTAKPAPISQVKAPFVDVGQRVKANDTVCLIEVMKLFNSISAGKDGTVVQILVDNGALVEHDQPLIYVMPDLVDEG
jgi:biotin carboxyl carrier protein